MFVIIAIISQLLHGHDQRCPQEENNERQYFLAEDFVWFNNGVKPGSRSNILASFFAGIGTHDQLRVDKKISKKKFESEA